MAKNLEVPKDQVSSRLIGQMHARALETIDQRAQIRRSAMVRIHQPGEDAFRSILPEDIDWKPFAAFPPTVRLAVLVGDPRQRGPYVVRVKVPSGGKLMPHKHPEDRIYTVMSRVVSICLGPTLRSDNLTAYPPRTACGLP